MPRWSSRKSTIQRLDKGSAGKVWARIFFGITAAMLSIATGAAGLVIEYVFTNLSSPEPDWVIFGWFLGILLVSLGLAFLGWWWRDKLLNQGVVIDLTVDEIGKPADRSSVWASNAMTAFAVIHHPFALGRFQSGGDHVIDISSTIREAITDYETLLWRHHGNDKLVLAPGGRNFPAQFGLGALAYLPGEMTLIEPVGKRSWNKPRHFIEFTGEQIRERIENEQTPAEALKVREKGVPTELSELGSNVLKTGIPLPEVNVVRFAFATVRGQNIKDWTPFKGTALEKVNVPTVYAGAIQQADSGEIRFSDIALRATSAEGHEPSADDVKPESSETPEPPEVDALDAAEYLATSLAWTLWRYPNADIHVTTRVPRTVAVAAGAILAAKPEWNVGDVTWTLPDFTDRLKLWGSLRPTESKLMPPDPKSGKDAKTVPKVEPKLALFEVFAQHTRSLPADMFDSSEAVLDRKNL